MKISLFLSEADEQRLHDILSHTNPGAKATAEQMTAVQAILGQSKPTAHAIDLDDRVGFDDKVSLTSPADPGDCFDLRVVMPSAEDINENHISILRPVALTIIGRRCGEVVAWETPGGRREMRITAVQKAGIHAPA